MSRDQDFNDPLLDGEEKKGGFEWENVGLKVGSKGLEVLGSCYGRVGRGELVGIVGSSGAGKTSLLNLLAFRLDQSSKVEGRVSVSGTTIKSHAQMQRLSSFVGQSDHFHPNLTPRSSED